MDRKIQAFVKYMGDIEEVSTSSQSVDVRHPDGITDVFTSVDDERNGDFLVLTDEEATLHAKAQIEGSLWAFNVDFLVKHTGVDESVISALRQQYEGGNHALSTLILDIDKLVQDALNLDGRGHYISNVDGEEYAAEYAGVTYYIYQID